MLVELVPAPPHISGPTWRRRADGRWWLPEKTLAWGVINWWAENLRQPGGPDAGQFFLPTLEQARFIAWWWAINEEGKFVYRSGILRRLKGWGKDPLAAAMALAELCGPVAFGGWNPDGEPIGVPKSSPWIQVAAVSQDQTRNTF